MRPWSVLRQKGPAVTVVGYSHLDGNALRERLSLATPAIRNAVTSVTSAPVALRQGQQVRFSVRLAPTVNVTGKGEKDAFLLSPPNSIRGEVYGDYLTKRLRGATIKAAEMTRFRLEKIVRPHRGENAPESGLGSRTVPDAVLEGVLTIDDPAVFGETLASGVGRQRAYGRGFVRLEPLALDRAA